jgi:hypothetical protein
LASGRQLWRLNAFGRLQLVQDEVPPISSNEAKTVIGAEFERLGLTAPRRTSEAESGSGRYAD